MYGHGEGASAQGAGGGAASEVEKPLRGARHDGHWQQGERDIEGGYAATGGSVPTADAVHWAADDADIPVAHAIEDYDVVVRHGFIRKVFGIVFVQLCVTFGWVLLCTYHDSTKHYLREHPWPSTVGFVLALGSIVCMFCASHLLRRHPHNYIFVGIFTIAQTLVLGGVAVESQAEYMGMAVGTTLLLVAALVAFSFQTKYDFTGAGPYLFIGLWCMILYSFIAAIFGGGNSLILPAFGTILFSMYLVFDVQLVIGGKHNRFSFSIDDYCFAAINIYLDIINLFLQILRLLSREN